MLWHAVIEKTTFGKGFSRRMCTRAYNMIYMKTHWNAVGGILMEEQRLLLITMKNSLNPGLYRIMMLIIQLMFYTYLQRTDKVTNIILLCWMKSVRLKILLKNNRKNNRTIERNNKKYQHKGGWKVFFPCL